jgi:hypothetical protein
VTSALQALIGRTAADTDGQIHQVPAVAWTFLVDDERGRPRDGRAMDMVRTGTQLQRLLGDRPADLDHP